MMDPNQVERAKQACLKQSYGAELSVEEQGLLSQFLESETGKQYQEESSEMKRLLGELATVEVHDSVDSAAMVTAFEEMAREELRSSRRRFPLALMATSGIALLTGGLSLQSGREDVVFFGWTMMAFAPMCAVLFVAIWLKDGKWLEDPDLLLRIEEEQKQGESKVAVFVWTVFAAFMLIMLGIGVWQAGGLQAIGIAIFSSLVVSFIGRAYMKAKRAQNQELWDWWDDRTSSN